MVQPLGSPKPVLAHLPFPPEVRLIIYNYVLTEHYDAAIQLHGNIAKMYDMSVKATDYQPTIQNLSLLLVSRQTYLEAYHVFYRVNIFSFGDVGVLYQFLKNIGLARRQHVRRICFVWIGDNAKKTFRLLKKCSRLRAIDIVLHSRKRSSWSYPRGTDYGALREVRGLETVNFARQTPSDTSIIGKPVMKPKLESLRQAMMRPRLSRFSATPDESINLFKPKKEISRKTELDWLKANHG